MYFVWCSGINEKIPTFVHQSMESAKKECERLSINNPGLEFHILVSLGFCKKEVEWTKMHEHDNGDLPS